MLPLDPQRVAELQRRLAARQLREEDFQILPDLLAWFRQLGQWLSKDELTEERRQDLPVGSTPAAEQAAPAEKPNRRARRPRRSARSAAKKRSRNRRR
jgi:hypothetical protein